MNETEFFTLIKSSRIDAKSFSQYWNKQAAFTISNWKSLFPFSGSLRFLFFILILWVRPYSRYRIICWNLIFLRYLTNGYQIIEQNTISSIAILFIYIYPRNKSEWIVSVNDGSVAKLLFVISMYFDLAKWMFELF